MKTTKILSLDAGGLKGIYSALVIAKIEKKYKIDFNSNFHYYTGTSIGGVISAALASGVKPEHVASALLEFKNEIHKGHTYLVGKLFAWIESLFQQKTLGYIKPKLFLPLFHFSSRQHFYISNYSWFDDLKIADVLKAACSDLRIMKPYKLGNLGLFADAAFFAYDPALFFLRTHQAELITPPNIISIGSGFITNASEDLNKDDIFDALYDSLLEEQFMTTQFFFAKTKGINYLRISEFPLINAKKFSFDYIGEMVENRVSMLDPEALSVYR